VGLRQPRQNGNTAPGEGSEVVFAPTSAPPPSACRPSLFSAAKAAQSGELRTWRETFAEQRRVDPNSHESQAAPRDRRSDGTLHRTWAGWNAREAGCDVASLSRSSFRRFLRHGRPVASPPPPAITPVPIISTPRYMVVGRRREQGGGKTNSPSHPW